MSDNDIKRWLEIAKEDAESGALALRYVVPGLCFDFEDLARRVQERIDEINATQSQ